MKHLKRFVAITISMVMAFQFCTNDFYLYAETELADPDQTEVTSESESEPSDSTGEAAEETPSSDIGTPEPSAPVEEQPAAPVEEQPAAPVEEQPEVASTLKIEFVDVSDASVKETVEQALESKYVKDTINLDELGIDTNVEGYTLTEVKDKNDNTQVYTTETKDFVLTGNVTELQFVYTQNVQTDQPEDSQEPSTPQGEQEESEDEAESEKNIVSLTINYVTRNNSMAKEAIEGKDSAQIEGTEGQVVQLDQYKVEIEGYTLSSESEGLKEITLSNADTSIDLIYEKDGSRKATAMLADESATTYNITYASNYPEGAKKYDSKNGSSETTIVDAVPTNAVYTYSSGSLATIIEGFNLANSSFIRWNTKADGTGTSYSPGDTLEVKENTVLYAQWTKLSKIEEITLRVNYYYGQRDQYHVTINVTALDLGDRRVSFMLANLQDVIAKIKEEQGNSYYDVSHFSGWKINDVTYGLNETCTVNYSTDWHGNKYVKVYPVDDSTETTAQFFVLNGTTATGNKEDYYSVGSGTLVGDGPGRQVGSDQNTGGDVSEYIENAPSPSQIADILNVSLEGPNLLDGML